MIDHPLTPDEVIAALERILRSDAFMSSQRSRSFLSYVVTETLADRGARLSERTVGRRALDRPDDFDGRFDASVRVRATRVRKALETYYETAEDPVRIDLPPGTYIPVFQRAEPRQMPLQGNAVAVMTSPGDDDALSEALSQEMVRQLGIFPGLQVVGPLPLTTSDYRSASERLGVRFVLQCTAHGEADGPSVELRVVDTTSDATLWNVRELLPGQGPAGFDVARWALTIAAQIGDYNGVILTRAAESHSPGAQQWQAMQSYYAMFLTGERTAVLTAIDRLTRLNSSRNRTPLTVAAAAHSLAVKVGYGLSDDAAADMAAATSLAEEALHLDPASATAHLALATVALVDECPQDAVEHARRAAGLAAFHPSILGTAGTLMAHAGDWDDGVAAIRTALHLNPSLPGFSRVLLVMDHMFAGDDPLALAEASFIQTPSEVWGPYFRALVLAGLGYRQRARSEMAVALELDPTVMDDLDRVVPGWVQLTNRQRQFLTERLRMVASDG